MNWEQFADKIKFPQIETLVILREDDSVTKGISYFITMITGSVIQQITHFLTYFCKWWTATTTKCEWHCGDGKCIHLTDVCNGVFDCLGREDEENCAPGN